MSTIESRLDIGRRLQLPSSLKSAHILLIAILLLAAFTRFWRLGVPAECYFDEVYFPTNGAIILHGDDSKEAGAWNFYGTENTHPPLSKLIMATGMGIFGHDDNLHIGSVCWQDKEDKDARRNIDPDWIYKPFGWRFFGAVAGVGAVFFIYLLGRKLFNSEVAGLAAAFLLTLDGLAFTQSRIATPDTYVLFFVLGAVYFAISNRFAFSGLFLGAAASCKWIGGLALGPIALYFIWRLLRGIRETETTQGLMEVEPLFGIGAGGLAAGFGIIELSRIFGAERLIGVPSPPSLGSFPEGPMYFAGALIAVAGAFIILGGLLMIAASKELRNSARGRLYLTTAIAFPIFFLLVPFSVYALQYAPMMAKGHSLSDVWNLNKMAYEFHSQSGLGHPYQSPWDIWPIDARPVFLYSDTNDDSTKIYNLSNPLIAWASLPALAFLLWEGIKSVRIMAQEATGKLSIRLSLASWQMPVLFVVLGYLGFWIPMVAVSRSTFSYHYLSALSFAILALAYCIHRLWDRPDRAGVADEPLSEDILQRAGLEVAIGMVLGVVGICLTIINVSWGGPQWLNVILVIAAVVGAIGILRGVARGPMSYGRVAVVAFLAAVAITFVYFYPHWTAVDAPSWLERTYYWEWLPDWLGFNWR